MWHFSVSIHSLNLVVTEVTAKDYELNELCMFFSSLTSVYDRNILWTKSGATIRLFISSNEQEQLWTILLRRFLFYRCSTDNVCLKLYSFLNVLVWKHMWKMYRHDWTGLQQNTLQRHSCLIGYGTNYGFIFLYIHIK